MDMKKVANVASVILNLVIVFPLFSGFALSVSTYTYLKHESISEFYGGMWDMLIILPPSLIITVFIVPFIFAQTLTTVALRLVLKYVSNDGK